MPFEDVEKRMQGRMPNPVDIIVGQNIRFQRFQKGISQEALANRLGLTFQQIQKYEKGTNRISASRLVQIASVFGIGVTELFDGVTGANGSNDLTLAKLLESHGAIELLQAFGALKNKQIRTAIIELILQIAASAS